MALPASEECSCKAGFSIALCAPSESTTRKWGVFTVRRNAHVCGRALHKFSTPDVEKRVSLVSVLLQGLDRFRRGKHKEFDFAALCFEFHFFRYRQSTMRPVPTTSLRHFPGISSSIETGVCPNSSRNFFDASLFRLPILPRSITTSYSYVTPSIRIEPKEKSSKRIFTSGRCSPTGADWGQFHGAMDLGDYARR